MTAKVLVLSGYGLNCEEETLFAFQHAGMKGVIRHINDLIENPKELEDIQILAIPGGFSYGDDTGSGNAFAQKMKLSLWEHLTKFVERDTLTIGICNGCQILTNLGLVPALNGRYGERPVALTYNLTARYQCRWVDVKVGSSKSPWLAGVNTLHIPVAHGEGRFMMSPETLAAIQNQVAFRYIKPSLLSSRTPQAEGSHNNRGDSSASPRNDTLELAKGQFPFNPNGATDDIAAITDHSGRVLAMMPHPERGMFTWQRDDYDRLKDHALREGKTLPAEADGMALFKNAAAYFEVAKRKSA
ncbi:MAG TPA: phosphoribosylformylglycinamidine synthase [Rhodospirillaceae bacterium]|nr:phosphoribosylformylglycinamidine synthase [Rhodospirillaceae bacterium]